MANHADVHALEPQTTLGFPEASELAAFRAVAEGLDTRAAVARYAPHLLGDGRSARAVIGRTRRTLQRTARLAGRDDLLEVLNAARTRPGTRRASRVSSAIEELRSAVPKQPMIGDAVEEWFAPRTVTALHAAGIKTLAALTLRVPRRRRWWAKIPGLGQASARRVEAFFSEHPDLTERARALVTAEQVSQIAPWETIVVPEELNGTHGRFRAPLSTCVLSARDDYEAVQAWIERHEAVSTQRAYRKEAERLILWAVVQRGKALSSLTAEDATAYRAFLRNPLPKGRWVGPARPRTSSEWRPFVGPLAATSVKYAVSVLGALFRWLVEQHYVVANPFAGLKVRGGTALPPAESGKWFTQAEWRLVRVVADGLEWSYGWSKDAAHRLRFVLDFGRGTGLRPFELCDATLGDISIDELNDGWISVVGKGAKKAKVSLPPLVRKALDNYLIRRGEPTSPNLWAPASPIVASISDDGSAGISRTRLLSVLKRFFETAAEVLGSGNPALGLKLRSATTHWMRHTHATHALELGASLTTVRDNLRHASVSTTSGYLHSDQSRRAATLAKAFHDPEASPG